jgi:GNAT superfamily N-acetyltransferase
MIAKAVAEDIFSLNTLINSAYRGEFSKKGWTTEAHLLEGGRTTEAELLDIIQDASNTILKYSDNGKIIGCYIVADRKLRQMPDKKGIEGIGLCILPEYRGKGYGELLKDWLEKYAKENNYDFVFGQHLKSLHNLEPWLKRRELYAEDSHSYYTIKWINKAS